MGRVYEDGVGAIAGLRCTEKCRSKNKSRGLSSISIGKSRARVPRRFTRPAEALATSLVGYISQLSILFEPKQVGGASRGLLH